MRKFRSLSVISSVLLFLGILPVNYEKAYSAASDYNWYTVGGEESGEVIVPEVDRNKTVTAVYIIGEKAFLFCFALKTATFGNDVKAIRPDAFMGCASLENVSLGSSVKSVGTGAFGDFKIGDLSNYPCGLREITIQPTVEVIGALPRAIGEPATTGIGGYATHPLTDVQECVFDSECVIKGYKGTEAERYANEWGLEFEALEAEAGDVNIDGVITIADAVALQRFLLGKYVGTGAYYGDMNGDDIVDAFDMIIMRKRLIENI